MPFLYIASPLYDTSGNITKILYNSGLEISYVYDSLDQLIRENNQLLGKTYIYSYDTSGNITSVKEYSYTTAASPAGTYTETAYGYTDGEWGDLLTSFKGVSITYDGIGNPLSYYNGKSSYSFTWDGRNLISAAKSGSVYSYTYNDSGYRTQKTVGGVTTDYYYNGSQLIAEKSGQGLTVYVYDELGAPIGFMYREQSYAKSEWDVYWYEKNIQGDVVAVYSNNGTKLVSYTYDAWGNFTVIYHNGGASYAPITSNPITYRGYYFDHNLGLYYLGSRYYDPNTRRFINADRFASTGQGFTSSNMFVYCGNNPVMRVDHSGNSWKVIGDFFGKIVDDIKGFCSETFGYEHRTSAGWEDSEYLLNGYYGRAGFSKYETVTTGEGNILYAFTGTTYDLTSSDGYINYAGIGMNLFDVFKLEQQYNHIGFTNRIEILGVLLESEVTINGATSITIGYNEEKEEGFTVTRALTAGINTRILMEAGSIYWGTQKYPSKIPGKHQPLLPFPVTP